MTKPIKYAVSDLNGTLIDAMPTYTRVFSGILKKRKGLPEEEVSEFSIRSAGTPWDEQFSAVLKRYGQPQDEVPEMMNEFCELVNNERYSLYPKAEELLKSFKEKGWKVFITSGSATGPVIRRFYEMGIFSYIDFVLGFDIYKKGPKHLEMLAEKEGLPMPEFAEQAIYFGDGPGDMILAKSCGLYTVGVAQTLEEKFLLQAGADKVIAKIGDALETDWEKARL